MFEWIKRKTKAVTVLRMGPASSEAGLAREARPPSYQEVMAAKRRRAKVRRKRRNVA